MFYFVVRWLLITGTILLTSWFMPGIQLIGARYTPYLAAAILGFLNAALQPPVPSQSGASFYLAIGVFALATNTLFFYLAAWLAPGFVRIDDFAWGMVSVVVISAVATVLNGALREDKRG